MVLEGSGALLAVDAEECGGGADEDCEERVGFSGLLFG